MSDDQSRPAEKWDPLTSPYWDRPEESLAAEEKLEVEEQFTSRSIPQPPKVDEILRGEYTGWVPLIKPGDSIETATIRFEVDNAKREADKNTSYEQLFEEPAEVTPATGVTAEDISEIKDAIREMKSESDVFVKDFYPNFKDIAENPETVASPAQALEEARRRIEQMRANLQVNLSRVQQSFEHPIFEPRPVDEVIVEAVREEPVQPAPVVFDYVASEEQAHEDQIVDEIVEEILEEVKPEPVREAPRVTEPITQVAEQAPQKEDHSLELVIMRDEIKDLRDRLDASQKLIETLMERLANLAELALTRRD